MELNAAATPGADGGLSPSLFVQSARRKYCFGQAPLQTFVQGEQSDKGLGGRTPLGWRFQSNALRWSRACEAGAGALCLERQQQQQQLCSSSALCSSSRVTCTVGAVQGKHPPMTFSGYEVDSFELKLARTWNSPGRFVRTFLLSAAVMTTRPATRL